MPRKSKRCTKDNENQIVQVEDDVPNWLPTDWSMVIQTRKSGYRAGQKYKCYIAPFTGFKLYTKRQVFSYLKTGKLRSRASEPNERDTRMHSTESARKVVVEKHTAEELPSGWIKEIKVTQLADRTRRDLSYIDSVTGYEFRSKKDVFRYLESGDVGKCASMPKKRQIGDMESIDAEIFAQTSTPATGTTSFPVATPTPPPAVASAAPEAGASCTHQVPPMNVFLPAFPGWTYWKLGKEAPIPPAETVHGVPCGYDYVPAHRYEDLVNMVSSLKKMVSGLTEENAQLRSNMEGYWEANIALCKELEMRAAAVTTIGTTPRVTPPTIEPMATVSRNSIPASSRPAVPTSAAPRVLRSATAALAAVPRRIAPTTESSDDESDDEEESEEESEEGD
ncbi:uncharacterized protein LOC122086983 isoform X3 [Macadamia integrifolia]|nr:uncharacterized protein LOC122086983 isoform X3 [Macadamia integrifolia]XP_042511856.1 uncharacterized protein LOC122086983 isoform X3 [Macadamia integrifolia]XP_042511857.1 uncharacterized protein LOC122086983 isoform X3 [Macadamia integrifolia]